MLQRTWPRVNQSNRLITANYQIISRIPKIMDLEMPPIAKEIADVMGEICDGAAEAIPSVSCVLGDSFVARLRFKVAVPFVAIVLMFVIERVRGWMVYKSDQSLAADGTTELGWRVKVKKAVLRSHVSCEMGGWIFAIVYLLYPSTSAMVFQTFFCRRLNDEGMMVLTADYSLLCYNVDGSMHDDYQGNLIFAIFGVLFWSMGVPIYFGWRLYRNRAAISKCNFDYYDIAPFRPLCMFMKPNCYMFEIFFMFEKLILCGFLGIIRVYIGGFILTNTLSLITTLVVMCVVVAIRPSKTEPYNTANIFSHGLIAVNLLATCMLKVKTANEDWITAERIGLLLAVIQTPFWIYLLKVSYDKFRATYAQAKGEEERKAKMKKKTLSNTVEDEDEAREAMQGWTIAAIARRCYDDEIQLHLVAAAREADNQKLALIELIIVNAREVDTNSAHLKDAFNVLTAAIPMDNP